MLAPSAVRNAALFATASIMAADEAIVQRDGSVALARQTLQQAEGVCSEESFATQPSLGFCTGMLVGPELLLTAGHCLAWLSCARLAIVFRFHFVSTVSLESISRDDVYACREVLALEVSEAGGVNRLDYAWIRLDRKVSAPLEPLALQPRDDLRDGESVTLVGHGAGLPTKIAGGGRIVSARAEARDYFSASVDNFAGGSGSGVFDARGALVGIAARGMGDFELTDRGCARAAQGDPETGEQITYLSRAIEGLCASGAPHGPCGRAATAASATGCSVSRFTRPGSRCWPVLLLAVLAARVSPLRSVRAPRRARSARRSNCGTN